MARLATDLTRDEIIAILQERDGDRCMFPGCVKGWDKGNHMITFDHKYPQHLAKAAGWTREETDHIDNLQLMGKSCNSLKGHQLPDENGEFKIAVREPKVVKQPRPDLCDTCFSGRILLPGEECPDCGIGPQPARWPTSLQRRPKECDHSTFHCFMCVAYEPDLRVSAISRIITGP